MRFIELAKSMVEAEPNVPRDGPSNTRKVCRHTPHDSRDFKQPTVFFHDPIIRRVFHSSSDFDFSRGDQPATAPSTRVTLVFNQF
jgi:hypothetical protein